MLYSELSNQRFRSPSFLMRLSDEKPETVIMDNLSFFAVIAALIIFSVAHLSNSQYELSIKYLSVYFEEKWNEEYYKITTSTND